MVKRADVLQRTCPGKVNRDLESCREPCPELLGLHTAIKILAEFQCKDMLTVAIDRAQIKIRTCVVDINVRRVRSEERMGDDGSKSKDQARHAAGMVDLLHVTLSAWIHSNFILYSLLYASKWCQRPAQHPVMKTLASRLYLEHFERMAYLLDRYRDFLYCFRRHLPGGRSIED